MYRIINKIAKQFSLETKFKEFTLKQIDNINLKINKFPLPFDFQIKLSDYDLSNEDCIGMAMFSEQYDVSILPIAINFQFIADEFFINNNMINIQNEITITLWHELAHGLIWAISDNGYDIPFDYDNEEICEQFGKAQGNLNNSKLGKWINSFKWLID